MVAQTDPILPNRLDEPPSYFQLSTTNGTASYKELRGHYTIWRREFILHTVAMHGLELALPFMDRDFISFIMATPGEIISCNAVPKGIMKSALWGRLPEGIAHRQDKADFTRLANEGLTQDYASLVQRLQGGLAVRFGYVDARTLNEELIRQWAGLKEETHYAAKNLMGLIGLEMWLQVFCQPQKERIAQ